MTDPQIEIEQCFLGALIASDDAFKKSPSLESAHFIVPVHGEIYDSIRRRQIEGNPISVALLALEFDKHADIAHLGGSQYIKNLADNVISVVAAPDYARTIHQAHCKRAITQEAINCDGSPEGLRQAAKLFDTLAASGMDKNVRRLRAYSYAEAQILPPREPLIKGIIDRRSMSVVFGESNTGKTFLCLDMAFHVALGQRWNGMRTHQGKVLYVAAEAGLGLRERMSALLTHHALQEFPQMHIIPSGIDLHGSDKDAEEIVREAQMLGDVEMIVIDTLSRAMCGGNENSPEDMGAFIRNCDLIRAQAGAHVMVVHHSGKDTTKGGRGHSSLRAAVDTEIEVIKDAEGTITAEIKKQRDGCTGDKFNYQMKFVYLGKDDEGDTVGSCVLAPVDAPAAQSGKRFSPAQKRALGVLNDVLVDAGRQCIPKKGMQKLTVVRTEDFRTALSKSNISASDNPDSVRRQITRIMDDLNNKGITATYEDMTWIVGQTGQ